INRQTGHVVSVEEIDPGTGQRTRVPLDYTWPLAARPYAQDPYGHYGYHPGVENAGWSDPVHRCYVLRLRPTYPAYVQGPDPFPRQVRVTLPQSSGTVRVTLTSQPSTDRRPSHSQRLATGH